MFLTSSQARCYLSLTATAIALGVGTLLFADQGQVKLNSDSQTVSSEETATETRAKLNQTWQAGQNLKLAEEYRLEAQVSPSESIDWSQTKIELDPSIKLDF